jgi:DNA repair protein RecO (recombination protein O)
VEHEPGYVLHSYPWRETSLIVEVFSRGHGRVALVAKGAKRPTSHFRGVVSPFCPLLLAWSGRAEIKTLIRSEWCGGLAPLRGEGLLTAFYLNELLVRLLARGDAHEQLFADYGKALYQLAHGRDAAATCRGFEIALLRETGLLPALGQSADGAPIEPQAMYRVDANRELVRVDIRTDAVCIRGSTVAALAAGVAMPDERAAAESRAALRHLIGYHLEGRPLNTPRILRDLREF